LSASRFASVLAALAAFVTLQGCAQLQGDSLSQQTQAAVIQAPAVVPAGGTQCATENSAAVAIQSEIAMVRSMAGLPPINCDTAAQSAATAHANYVVMNADLSHYETKGHPGFVGKTPDDRLEAFNFKYDVGGEVVGFDESAACILGVHGFINSVYHRTPFLRSANDVMGIGAVTGAVTIDFGRTESSDSNTARTVIWPPNGATNVPTSFYAANEHPNPIPEGNSEVGSPITLIASDCLEKVVVTMTDSAGKAIAGKTITHSNDSNVHSTDAHFVPYAPLASATKYTVTFKVTTDGKAQSFTTEFTTD
jgi:uncharacterized protein YkwD